MPIPTPNTILMDLDGTLLPFDQQAFIKVYFQLLCARLAPFGYQPEALVKAVWSGTEAMVKNDGTCLNHDRFWDCFAAVLGESVRELEPLLDEFYTDDFDKVRQVLRATSPAAAMVHSLRQKGYTPVLATNPLFPAVGVYTRMAWVGLQPSDFAHITHYQNSTFCKPDVRYYREILQTIGKAPEDCLMIGNNIREDMVAQTLGLHVFLVTDFLENPDNADPAAYPHGSLADAAELVQALPPL